MFKSLNLFIYVEFMEMLGVCYTNTNRLPINGVGTVHHCILVSIYSLKTKIHKPNAELQRADPGTKVTG